MDKLTSPEAPKKEFRVHFMRHGKPVVASEHYGTDQMPFHEFEEAINVERSMRLPLSEKGRAEILASLQKEDVSHVKLILSSPYLRTQQSAHVVSDYVEAKTGVKPVFHETKLLREVEFDQGAMTEEEYTRLMREKGFLGVLSVYDENWINGRQKTENIDDTYRRAERVVTYLRRVRKWTAHDVVFVSTHGWIGRVIKHIAEGGNKAEYLEKTRMLKTGEIFSFSEDDLIALEHE